MLFVAAAAATALLLLTTSSSASQTPYKMLTYDDIQNVVYELENKYPDLVDVYSAQDAPFFLNSPGSCGYGACKQLYIRITDESTLPDKDRPEIFLSGSLHGNERIGPTTTVEFMRMLVEHYAQYLSSGDDDQQQDGGGDWLTRLVARRSLWIMPSANAYGYYHDQRTDENNIDPNRDFPYNVDRKDECMQTIAARAINELWRKHAFRLAITFHAGQESISTTWGAFNHPSPDDIPPDDVAQLSLIKEMSTYGGEFYHPKNQGQRYNYGRLNDNVYPVNGGMEDWAYGAAWEEGVVKGGCAPTSYGGYSAAKTMYDDVTLRVVNVLVETSNDKSPSDVDFNIFGTREGVLRSTLPGGKGHVPRNIRLALLMADVAEPYVAWFGGPTSLAGMFSRMQRREAHNVHGKGAGTGAGAAAPDNKDKDEDEDKEMLGSSSLWVYPSDAQSSNGVEWYVGGAMSVDKTEIVVIKWPLSKFNGASCRCVSSQSFHKGSPIRIDWDVLSPVIVGVASSGVPDRPVRAQSPWSSHAGGKFTLPTDKTLRQLVLDADPNAEENDEEYVIMARASVDGTFGNKMARAWPGGMLPQSNFARSRTDSEWLKETEDGCRRVKGRKWWYSEEPLCVTLKKGGTFHQDMERLGDGNSGDGTSSSSSSEEQYEFIVEAVLKQLVPDKIDGSTEGVLRIGFLSSMSPIGVRRVRALSDASEFVVACCLSLLVVCCCFFFIVPLFLRCSFVVPLLLFLCFVLFF